MKYVPFHELGNSPNIIVDGSGNENTLIALSHWPKSGTPSELKDDLSVQIVFKYLENPKFHIKTDIVSNNHFDEDGLVGIYALLNPELAIKQKSLLIDIGNAGDFGTYKTREAAHIAFVLSAYADPDLSPFDPSIFEKEYSETCAYLYNQMLELFPDIINEPDRFRKFWQYEEELLSASETSIWTGKIKIEEFPNLDLAVVTLPEAMPERRVHRFTLERNAVCHPIALHNATNCNRILLIQGHNYELQYRYESWVQYISRKIIPRVDLSLLAKELSEKENGNGEWKFDGINLITPKLQLTGTEESKIMPEEFILKVKSFLETAKPAWNPYD